MAFSVRDQELRQRYRSRLRRIADEFSTLTDEQKLSYISPNGDPSEFEVQAYVYHELKRLGLLVRGEVKSRCGTCRFDLVVFVGNRPVRIIEVKKGRPALGTKTANAQIKKTRARQIRQYGKFGIPVDSIVAMRQARIYVEHVERTGSLPPTEG